MPDSGTRLPSRCVVMLSSVSYIDRHGHLVNEEAVVYALLQESSKAQLCNEKLRFTSATHRRCRAIPHRVALCKRVCPLGCTNSRRCPDRLPCDAGRHAPTNRPPLHPVVRIRAPVSSRPWRPTTVLREIGRASCRERVQIALGSGAVTR